MSTEIPSPLLDKRHACSACTLASFCPHQPKERLFQANEVVIRANSSMSNILIIKQGAAKSSQFLPTGKEQIINFYLPGEPIGFNALSERVHPHTVSALVDTIACEIPFQSLLSQSTHKPKLQLLLFNAINNFPRLEFNYHYSAAISPAQRLATFFINLANRLKQANLQYPFDLPMKQQDIANFLGTTPETISRLIAIFQKKKLIGLVKKKINFIDTDGLQLI
ncbi:MULTISPECIES: Crp/Fnr family transcriptional regulator [Legionella]|uniref:Transcriptional regulator, crp family n=1 Tax=Legionella maceachernii TaxID=466 RepID=A0A0W0VXH1_9GAMM|nr:Crp/Fnr family transcriptional regulator [Legionella maceachernii]KTD24606.1 transcriptional regulator, crp family [Legionella maceachernii]SKA25316.1 CRP/FNR family transcriptional regulator, anaerobic regulatory protein [Legionella maceachernii]SUO99401.1 Fumarate and nitrate reduction regulatory protein [Legionella maceachernii]